MKYFYFFTLLIFLASCQQEKTPTSMLYGKWRGDVWMVGGSPNRGLDPSVIQFEFKKDSAYSTAFGSQSETGDFHITDNTIYFNSIYKSKKKVPIIKQSKDSMIWMMDSVEQPGNLHLIRIK
jgi:hypothetical protein